MINFDKAATLTEAYNVMINDNKYHIIYPEFLLLEGVT